MILGIDVGGTHTDAVLIDGLRILNQSKVRTDESDLLNSLLEVTTALIPAVSYGGLERIVLSTTLSTNAIVQNKTDPVGMVLLCGPGLSPSQLPMTHDTILLDGYVNHRGMEMLAPDLRRVQGIAGHFQAKGIRNAGVVGKFSTRNPAQEKAVASILNAQMNHVSLGHRMSGHLNFPRRIATTRLNASVWNLYNHFVHEVLRFVRQREISAPVYVLKADGGTIAINPSREFPVQTILSGPAASIMGIMALCSVHEDAIALDIGGTTTDMALFADGVPLFEPFGVTVEGHKTLIRGFRTHSIGVGGDSAIHVDGPSLRIGPDRQGPAAALGGPLPTPTDALVVLGKCVLGNRERASASLFPLASAMDLSVDQLAQRIIAQTCAQIVGPVCAFIDEINTQPVYTIHDLLEGKRLVPRKLYVVGGPAGPLSEILGALLGCQPCVPRHSEIANAIGAALSRTTAEMTLLADTERRCLTIAEEGLQLAIPFQFTPDDAIRLGQERLCDQAVRMGAAEQEVEIEVIEAQKFNMVRGFTHTGRNIRVKLQIKPGVMANYRGKTL